MHTVVLWLICQHRPFLPRELHIYESHFNKKPYFYHYYLSGSPVGMWTWGHVHTKFWQPPKPYSNQRGQILPTIY